MTVIPQEDVVLLYIYRCPICNGLYSGQPGPWKISCLVMHPPGSCCHYEERELKRGQIRKIENILRANK